MNITIRHKIYCSVSEVDPKIQSEKEKLSVSVSAVSIRIRSIFPGKQSPQPPTLFMRNSLE
jgi:hypothetical protein